MNTTGAYGALDRFRLVAALLVIANHTGPLASFSAGADYLLTHLRLTVPFFFMLTGFFVLAPCFAEPELGAGRVRRFLRKNGLIYLAAMALYLPLNLYAGQFVGHSPLSLLRRVLFEGTMYHLWYLPASLLGVLLVYGLLRWLPRKAWLPLAAGLFLIGLGGDSYLGITQQLPGLSSFYAGVMRVMAGTRNGLFYAPLYLLLGAYIAQTDKRLPRWWSGLGALLCLLLMQGEAWLLRSHWPAGADSFYLLQPLLMICLFQCLLNWQVKPAGALRQLTMLVCLLHPWCIVLVRGAAKLLAWPLLVEQSLLYYLAVCLLSFGLAAALLYLKRRLRQPRGGFAQGRAWLELDLHNLQHNLHELRQLLPQDCRMMAVLKADAYGHGACRLGRELNRLGVRDFAVATVEEAAALRRAGVRGDILVLGYTHPKQLHLLVRYRLLQTVVDADYAALLDSYGRKLRVHLKIDTGMHRLGEESSHLSRILDIFEKDNLLVEGMYTHLCLADRQDAEARDFTRRQIGQFYALAEQLSMAGYPCPQLHIQSSYGLLNYPDLPCDFVRVGIALYGLVGDGEAAALADRLRPVLSLKARVGAVKHLDQGEGVGYGLTFRAPRPMRTAIVTVGYADGLPRNLRDGYVLLHEQRAAILGSICMDQVLVDVTEIPEVEPGDTAVVIGHDHAQEISACQLARQAGTISNEILSRLGGRLQRVYLEDLKSPW